MPNTSGDFPMPYPNSSAVPDVPGDILLLAQAVTDALGDRYSLRETVYFTSSGTFSKASYPWLRAIRVTCVGGGGAGAGTTTNNRGTGGGGAGETSESFITDIAGLASSVTVTVGAGGVGALSLTSANGADTSFGATVVATGGKGTIEASGIDGGRGGTGGTGDFKIAGGDGGPGGAAGTPGGVGGSSRFGGGGAGGPQSGSSNTAGASGVAYGSGGGGGFRATASVAGGSGASGVVIVELFG